MSIPEFVQIQHDPRSFNNGCVAGAPFGVGEGICLTQSDSEDLPQILIIMDDFNDISELMRRVRVGMLNVPLYNGNGYVRYSNHMGDENYSLETARMSTLNATVTGESVKVDDNFRDMLWRSGHWTPFESLILSVEIQSPIHIARQVYTYRTFARNEMSGRYSELPELNYEPVLDEVRYQSKVNKQMAAEVMPVDYAMEFLQMVRDNHTGSRAAYNKAIKMGVAKEMARILLPVSQITRYRITGSLRNWAHFLDQRTKADAQPQIQELAWGIAAVIKALWPKHYALIEEYTLNSKKLHRTELAVIKGLLERGIPTGRLESELISSGVTGRRLKEVLEVFQATKD